MREQFRRRRLPHWDRPGATYFVTACLAGSIPAQGLLDIRAYHDQLLANRPKDQSPEQWNDVVWKKTFVEREKWLDGQPAVRCLEQPELAASVVNSLRFFHNQRYHLIAFVVMPSHFHWLFRPDDDWVSTLSKERSPREVIMHSIKSYTAHECNVLRGQHGVFWQDESYDHCVRDEDELERILNYIELNPVKAGLCARREEWPYSSACGRKEA